VRFEMCRRYVRTLALVCKRIEKLPHQLHTNASSTRGSAVDYEAFTTIAGDPFVMALCRTLAQCLQHRRPWLNTAIVRIAQLIQWYEV
jgi:hypothetical protein